MAEAPRDGNRVATLIGVDSVGFTTPTTVAVNSSHEMLVSATFSPSGTQDVNLTKVAGTAVSLGQKAMTASIPVVLSSDQASIPVTVSGVATAANQTTIIGHLDGVEALLTTIDADTSNLSVVGGGTEAAAIRVTIASDSTGVLSIDDNGGTLTVDNAGLTELAAAINGSSQMDVNLAASNATVTVSATNLDIRDLTSTDVVTANLSATDNAVLDNIDADTSAIQTAVELIDDSVATLGTTTYTEATTKGLTIGAVRRDADTTLVNTTNEIGPLQMDANGRLKVEVFSGETLPVSLTSTTITGTVAVTQSGTWDEVGINDSGNSITVDNTVLSVVGSGTEATAQRVTIATDSTGVLSVDDNGSTISIDDGAGAITVDGTVAFSNTTIATTNAGTFVVQENGAALTALQLIDDAVFADDADWTDNTSKHLLVGGVYQSTQHTVTDGDVSPFAVDENGNLRVNIVAGAAAGGTSQADDADFTAGTTAGTPAMGVYDSTPDTVTDGDLGTIGINANRAVRTVIEAGSAAIGKLAANSGVDIGDVDITSIAAGDNNIGNVDIVSGTITTVSTVTALGTGTTGPMKAEDVGHTTGDMGFPAWGVRTDVPNAVGAGTTGDYSFLATDMAGGIRTALYETDFAVLGTKHVKKYYTNAGAVTDGIVWSPAAGTRWYVTDIFINVSAAATITLEDDKAGGDEAVWKMEAAANSGWSHHFGTPLFSGEDAADLLITTTAGNVYVTVTGYEI